MFLLSYVDFVLIFQGSSLEENKKNLFFAGNCYRGLTQYISAFEKFVTLRFNLGSCEIAFP